MSHPSEATLHDFVDEELPLDERARVAAHLGECAQCHATVTALTRLREQASAALGDAVVEPAADAWSRVAARIEARSVIPLPVRRTPWLARAAAVIALLGLSGSALWMGLRTRPAVVADVAAPPADSLAVRLAADSPAAAIEGAYGPALAELEQAIAANRDRLAPETIAAVEANLAVLDRAIEEIRSALEADPANRGGLDALHGTYRAKLDILRRAAKFAPAA